MRPLILFLSIVWTTSLIGCGSDASSHRPDTGWQIREDAGSREQPRGIPREYVDHPNDEKRFSLPADDHCDVPEWHNDAFGVLGKFDQPIVGAVLILGLQPVEFEPTSVELFNYNFFIRFPNKSDRWHRFEFRPTGPGEAYRIVWGDMEEPRVYVHPTAIALSVAQVMPDCQIPTREDIEAFVAEFSTLEIIFHNPETNQIYRFEPPEPGAVQVNDPIYVLHDHEAAVLTWDLPINRPQEPIRPFLRPRP